jgi:hypothetical protein
VNANDATLTGLATARTGSTARHLAPNAPATSSFDLILQAAAGSALGNSGTPYTLTISAIDLTSVSQGWPTVTLHQSRQRVETQRHRPGLPVHPDPPGSRPRWRPRRPAGGHTLQCRASLISRGAWIVSMIHSNPFVLV